MIKLGDYIVTPTMFSDKTSQIWKIPEEVLKKKSIITWDFENEAELSHVIQLAALFTLEKGRMPALYMPYLIYGRQDKDIANDKTFARNVIIPILTKYFYKIVTLDSHSKVSGVHNIIPDLNKLFLDTKPDIICFPDKGASTRGYDTAFFPFFSLDKVRNQSTGVIEGLKFQDNFDVDLKDKTVLILDDICDRGGTFIGAAKLLREVGAKSVILYTTHGIYSGGTKLIFDNGIDRIFNYKGEVKNDE